MNQDAKPLVNTPDAVLAAPPGSFDLSSTAGAMLEQAIGYEAADPALFAPEWRALVDADAEARKLR